eukprot:scaffold41674_cov56-Attheya_sp.AAC.4
MGAAFVRLFVCSVDSSSSLLSFCLVVTVAIVVPCWGLHPRVEGFKSRFNIGILRSCPTASNAVQTAAGILCDSSLPFVVATFSKLNGPTSRAFSRLSWSSYHARVGSRLSAAFTLAGPISSIVPRNPSDRMRWISGQY